MRFAFIFSQNVSVSYVGNTVIHLDQALARMREYERMKTEAESSTNMRCTCRILEAEDGAAAPSTVANLEGVFLAEYKYRNYSFLCKENVYAHLIIVLVPLSFSY